MASRALSHGEGQVVWSDSGDFDENPMTMPELRQRYDAVLEELRRNEALASLTRRNISKTVLQIQLMASKATRLEAKLATALKAADMVGTPQDCEEDSVHALFLKNYDELPESDKRTVDTIAHKYRMKMNRIEQGLTVAQNRNKAVFKELKELEARLHFLEFDEYVGNEKMIVAKRELDDYRMNSERNSHRARFLRDQLGERKLEVRDRRLRKAEAERYLVMLKDREESESAEESIEEVKKSIRSREDELLHLEREITEMRENMEKLGKIGNDNEAIRMETYYQEHANWEKERDTLIKSRKELKSQILDLSKIIGVDGQARRDMDAKSTTSAGQSEVVSHRSIDGTGASQTSKGTASQRGQLTDADSASKVGEKGKKLTPLVIKRKALADAIDRNKKLQSKSTRATRRLRIAVEAFQAQENNIEVEEARLSKSFRAEESNMLEKIKGLKIKLAQLEWNRRNQSR